MECDRVGARGGVYLTIIHEFWTVICSHDVKNSRKSPKDLCIDIYGRAMISTNEARVHTAIELILCFSLFLVTVCLLLILNCTTLFHDVEDSCWYG